MTRIFIPEPCIGGLGVYEKLLKRILEERGITGIDTMAETGLSPEVFDGEPAASFALVHVVPRDGIRRRFSPTERGDDFVKGVAVVN